MVLYKILLNYINLKLVFKVIALVCICLWSNAYSVENSENERDKNMKIAIITAMQSEFDAVHSLYNFKGDNKEAIAKVYGMEILLIKSGIGKVHGALAAQKAFEAGADLVINTGLAGGIDKSLEQGDIVLADKVGYHDVYCGEGNAKGQVQDLPLYYMAPQNLIQKLAKQAPEFHVGLIVTGDQFVNDVNHLKEIKQDFLEAQAVDMESAAIAQTCYLNNISYLSLRIISDVVGKPNQEDQFNNFWKNVPTKASEMVDKALKIISTN